MRAARFYRAALCPRVQRILGFVVEIAAVDMSRESAKLQLRLNMGSWRCAFDYQQWTRECSRRMNT